MGQGDETTQDDAPFEDELTARDATLTAAILRIAASLDLDTMLREVVPGSGNDEDAPPAVPAVPANNPRLLETKRPALAVLDLVLPGADGIELMRTLPGLADLPVIFISAYGEGDTVARALEAGATDYIVKPFSPAELAARVALSGAGIRRRRRSGSGSSRSTGRSAG